ncbi:glycerophosphoryl diester phosphodiesterase membrane domain-containing protein [Isoptericola sp. BMS4]|uniref:glycerophosphoryl diester phosphodiesterase membrane domain-containing protein n=1 Tax=Isoptericola sp. BMS4 TaxID=2527875 RepID=UPI00141EFFC9|nr:glycerophosphoryl diester phosphodiesterase membrane domain-containing protein [Isoptericola sp. BMS4]
MSTPDQPTPPSGWGEAPEPPRYGQPAPGAPAPPSGQYGHQQYGQARPQYGQQQYGQQPAGSPYGPPAVKPGIVPLRPLSLGEIYDGAFSAIRHNPGVMLGMATLVLLVATVLGVLIGQLVVPALSDAFGTVTSSEPELAGFASLYAQTIAASLGTALTTLLATPVVEGILTVSVSQSVIGRKLTVREVWARIRPRVLVLIGWALLRSLGATVLFTAWIALLVLVIAGLSGTSVAATVTLSVLLAAAGVVAAVWLMTRLLLVAPALALEGRGLGSTLPRAWRLTRRSFWRLFGVWLLAYIMVSIAAGIVTYPISFASSMFSLGGASTATTGIVVGTILTTVLTATIITIFLSSVVALQYVDVRMRREGLDVQLAAAAQAPEPGAERPGTPGTSTPPGPPPGMLA